MVLSEREQLIRNFVDAQGWAEAEILPIPGDASFRHYFRVVEPERRAILMDAPPPEEDPQPFIHVARYLTAQGLRAPEIFGVDAGHGLVLLEDFGDARMRETVDAGDAETERAIYRKAMVRRVACASYPAARYRANAAFLLAFSRPERSSV